MKPTSPASRRSFHLTHRSSTVLACLLCVIVLFLVSSISGGSAAPQTTSIPPLPDPQEEGWSVVRVYYATRADFARLTRQFAPWEVHPENGYILLGLSHHQISGLRSAGYRVEIDAVRTANFSVLPGRAGEAESGLPGFACYRTVDETFASAASLAEAYPHLAAWNDIGDGWLKFSGQAGDDLWVLKLTRNTGEPDKPKLLVTGSLHARELAPAELVLRFGEYLLQNYGTDADITWLLNEHEIHLFILANPDGRRKVELGLQAPFQAPLVYWRKNTNSVGCTDQTGYGVDLNRNFSFAWGEYGGSSGFACDETYRGLSPASEPETGALEAYVRSLFPDSRSAGLDSPALENTHGLFVDIHSYGELILWPWGFDRLAPNAEQFETLGQRLADFNGYRAIQSSDLYPTSGGTDDFVYGELGVPGLAFEIGTTFLQQCEPFVSQILPDNLQALLYAAKASRAPYLLPAGPRVTSLSLSQPLANYGDLVTLTVVVDDSRFGGFTDPRQAQASQPVAAAEVYLNTPPWQADQPTTLLPLAPVDGEFDSPVESAYTDIDSSRLSPGRNILYVRARDAGGQWGVVSAIFLDVVGDRQPLYLPLINGMPVTAP